MYNPPLKMYTRLPQENSNETPKPFMTPGPLTHAIDIIISLTNRHKYIYISSQNKRIQKCPIYNERMHTTILACHWQ